MPGPGGPGGGPGGGFGGPGGGMGGPGGGMGGFGGPGMGGGRRPPSGGMHMGGMMGGSPRPTGGGIHMGGGGMGCGGSMLLVLLIGLGLLASSCAAFTTSQNFVWMLVFLGIIVAMVVILIVLKRRQEAKEKETEATERILNTPLEKYGDEVDEELENLESKYAKAAGVETGSKSKRGNGPNVAFCPECGAKALTSTQRFCASCGAELPTTGTSKKRASGAQSPDSSTN